MLKLPYNYTHDSKVMPKILQIRLQQYVNCEIPDVQAGFRKGRGTRDQIANIHWMAMAAHSSTLACKIPWMEEPGGLQSMGSLRVGHDWATALSLFTFTFRFQALEKEMATHSSVLAWRIPGTAEPGGLPSMGSHRVGHNWSNLAAAAAAAEVILNSIKPHWALVFIFETLWLDISGKQTCLIWELSNRAQYQCMKLSTPIRTSVSKP